MAHLSVVIPVYEAEGYLPELYRRLKSSLAKITKNYEIVLVEDCGLDRSWEIISKLSRKDKKVKAIQLSRNFGQHYAITAGLDHCDGDWVVVMDCDLQDQPEEIHKLYSQARKGFEIVLAVRRGRKDGMWKKATSWVFYKLFNLMTGLDYDGNVANFTIISRKVVSHIRTMRERLRFFGGMVNWVGLPVAKVTVPHANSARGRSSYTFKKLFKLASEAIIAYSDKPLWLAVRLGFAMAFVSMVVGGCFFVQALFNGVSVSGWGSLIVSLYFLSGIIIAILGIVGIYVGKTFDETKRRPLYLVQSTINVKKIGPF